MLMSSATTRYSVLHNGGACYTTVVRATQRCSVLHNSVACYTTISTAACVCVKTVESALLVDSMYTRIGKCHLCIAMDFG